MLITLEDENGKSCKLAGLISDEKIVMIFSIFVVLAGTVRAELNYLFNNLLLDGLRDHLIALLKVKRRLRPISLRLS